MRRSLIPLAAFALVVAVFPLKTQKSEGLALGPAPEYAPGEIEGYACEVRDDEVSRKALDACSVKVWRYADSFGRSFAVTVVIGGERRMSIHRPELCLTGQNCVITNVRKESVADVAWQRELLLRSEAPSNAFAYRFFNQDGFETPSYAVRHLRDTWDRIVRRQVDRWVFVSVAASTDDEAALSDFLARLRR